MKFTEFQQPASIFRPAPFWAINDRITPQETARQMSDMRRVGLSGGFFHSRAGLITDYLGEEWFAAMDAALQVAKDEDGYLWLYDEDLWPSGNAGGRVAGLKDEYRAAMLHAELLMPGELPTEFSESLVRAVYLVQRDGLTLTAVTQISEAEMADHLAEERLVFARIYEHKSGWWSGESYANLLDPEAMRQFMAFTHEVYAERYQAEFGKRIPGIFTDEPQVVQGKDSLPWYEGFPHNYAAWTGRDFWADLPYMFFDGPDCRKVRLLVHRGILRQFCESFSKPIFEWCEAHGLAHTGHYMNEDWFTTQISSHCGSVMAHYRYQQIPGIDHLCRSTDGLILALKQVGSAARQLGRKRVLTEIFGVSRHTSTFQDFKWIGDYDLVLGANLFCPHLTLYSARGRRKRDYPPNWNYQQTYWDELRPLNDYFTRVSAVLSAGEPGVDVLLLHPIETATAAHRKAVMSTRNLPGENMDVALEMEGNMRRILNAVLNAGYECDLGDEWFLEDYGSVEGNRLRIGQVAYTVVVVPPSITWRPKTVALLQQFAANGGKLLFLGRPPQEIDCDPAPDTWNALVAKTQTVPCATIQIQEALSKIAPATFTLRTSEGRYAHLTYLQHRVDAGQEIFFIVNNDRDHAQEYLFTRVADGKRLAVWHPVDGTRQAASTEMVGGEMRYTFTLPPAGSVLLVAGSDAVEETPAAETEHLLGGQVVPLASVWDFARSEGNVLVMDRLSASVDGGQSWLDEDMDFRVRYRLAKHFGVQDALTWQPWVAIHKGLFDDKGGPVILRYHFRNALAQPRPVFLVMEDLTKGKVTVNGRAVDLSQAGWQWDHDFGKIEITKYLQPGENVVEYATAYNFLTEVEPAYLVGDFGVRLISPYAGELIDEPQQLANGSWADQGYPFYSGAMTYRTTITAPAEGHRTFLRLQRASGILYKVRVNGADAGSILWQPHQLELTGALRGGENTLEITVIASRQNTLGPLHEKDGDDLIWCGPNAFENEHDIREELSLFDYGLLGGAELVVFPG